MGSGLGYRHTRCLCAVQPMKECALTIAGLTTMTACCWPAVICDCVHITGSWKGVQGVHECVGTHSSLLPERMMSMEWTGGASSGCLGGPYLATYSSSSSSRARQLVGSVAEHQLNCRSST